MKKILLFAAAAGITLSSCVKNESTNGFASDAKIAFDAPAVSGITRSSNVAGEISNPYSTAEHFTVYARYFANQYTTFDGGTAYMTGVETAYNQTGNYWDSESANNQAYYWPKQGTLTFAAYSPSGADEDCTVAWGATGFTFTNFAVNTDPAKHYDLMFSERSYNKTSSQGTSENYNGVDIQFKHALSSVVFKIKTDTEYAGHTIKVQSIKLLNTYQQGTFNQNLVDENNAMTTDAAAWSGQTNENTAGYEAVTADEETVTTAATALTNPNPIIVLPQPLAHDGENNVSIAVEYTIDNGNGAIDQTASIDISQNYGLTAFELGKRYIFNLVFGLDKIYFAPEVQDWNEVIVTPDIDL